MNIKLFFISLIFTGLLQAQTTAIPDANFEQALIDLGFDDVIDGQVLTSNIENETFLNLASTTIAGFITDYTGIEGFNSLQHLNLGAVAATALDLSNNVDLISVEMTEFYQNNALTSINLTGLTDLQMFTCRKSQLTHIDFSTNSALNEIYLGQNYQLENINVDNLNGLRSLNCFTSKLSSIDLSDNIALEFLNLSFNDLTTIDVSSNTLLEIINVSENEISNIDLSSNTLLDILYCNDNPNLNALDLNSNINLTQLDCSDSPLGTIDLSNNINLEILRVFRSQLTTLDVSNNPALIEVHCYSNHIVNLDLSNCPLLTTLNCSVNYGLSMLDVSNNALLETLSATLCYISSIDLTNNLNLNSLALGTNPLTNIDLHTNNLLTHIYLQNTPVLEFVNLKNGANDLISNFNITNSPNLNCLQVDNEVDANAGNGIYATWLKDSTVSYGQHCLDTYVPDDNFEQALIDLGYDTGALDDYVLTSDIEPILSLNIENESIIDLTGIQDFRDLEELRCRNNQIVDLDLSYNTNLTFLRLEDNLLETLNLKNGNNTILTTMRAQDNNLLCVEVDDEIAANAGTGSYSSWQVDNGVVYSERCGGCPEINLLGNGMSIANGDDTPDTNDHTDFGLVDFGNFVEYTFTIENIGIADLLLSGAPLITITNSTDFEVVELPEATIMANGGTASFTIRYTPSMVNTINTATVSFMSDDCDNATYTFDIIGQSQEALSVDVNSLKDDLRVYPNPNNGVFVLGYSGDIQLEQMIVCDITGKQLQRIPLLDFNHQKTLKLKLPTGFYLFKIQAYNQSIVKKIIIN
ncbi:choice-of-anchor D domain-containing protein [uncultured Psychroserpens sp.]|uniref:choice-of-anchor D domain-containing protein n=1 Tax=uncultured Psychroserpens sp. TaxID=255436 RepID=UPI00262C5F32|nr:choice-of-anchor D domain-containing protein [uncultured Psychroserpens sp.]